MSIIGALTPVIHNGDAVDATVVMSLFSFIQSQVNGNACPATSGSSVLKGDGAGGTTVAVSGTDYLVPSQFPFTAANPGNNGLGPSGISLKWGQVVGSASADVPVTFANPFTTTCYAVFINPASGANGFFASFNAITVNGFSAATWSATGTRAVTTCNWMAIGK